MYVCKNIQFIPIRKVEVFGSDKTSVIWKKKKDVAVTVIGLTTKMFMAWDGAAITSTNHLATKYVMNMNFKL